MGKLHLKVSKNRLCSLSPFLPMTPSCWTTWRLHSPSEKSSQEIIQTHLKQHASLGMGIRSLLEKDRHVSKHYHFKGEQAYLALQSLIQKEKTNQMCFETHLLLEPRQTRADLMLKTSILTCTIQPASHLSKSWSAGLLFWNSLACTSNQSLATETRQPQLIPEPAPTL